MQRGFLCRECGNRTVSYCKDSREVEIDGELVIKRRRECSTCGARYSTFERLDLTKEQAQEAKHIEEKLASQDRRLRRAIDNLKMVVREAELALEDA